VTKHTGELRGAQGCGNWLSCERSAEMREGAGANCGGCENTAGVAGRLCGEVRDSAEESRSAETDDRFDSQKNGVATPSSEERRRRLWRSSVPILRCWFPSQYHKCVVNSQVWWACVQHF